MKRHEIPLAIRAEFERRRREGQAGVNAGRMNRDSVNRNLSIWRDMAMWTDGQVPLGQCAFEVWADAAMTAAHKTATRINGSAPPPVAKGWNTETTAHANALRAASIKFTSYAAATTMLRVAA